MGSYLDPDALDVLLAQPVMGILRGFDPKRTVELCELLWASGVDAVEVPIQDARSRASFLAAVDRARELGRSVGVGTVIDVHQVSWALTYGASFAVSPGFDPAISAAAAEAGLPLVPGVATASEIQAARAAGHRWLKAFPAAQLGAGWIAAQLAPFPEVRFVATGGIDTDNAAEFLDAGARVVALGSAIERPEVRDRLASLLASRKETRTP